MGFDLSDFLVNRKSGTSHVQRKYVLTPREERRVRRLWEKAQTRKGRRAWFRKNRNGRVEATVAPVLARVAAGELGTPDAQRNVRLNIVAQIRRNIWETVVGEVKRGKEESYAEWKARVFREVDMRLDHELAEQGLTRDGDLA